MSPRPVFRLARSVVVLIAATAAAVFFLSGAAIKDRSLFGPTVAAWAQAVFAAVAVFAAAGLQARFVERQSLAARKRIHENAASAARWVWQSFERVQVAVEGKNLKGRDFLALDAHGALTIAMKALAELKLSDFDDEVLATAVFNLQSTMTRITAKREDQFETARFAPEPIVTEGWFSQDAVTVFNHAASVERRVAQLSHRQSAL